MLGVVNRFYQKKLENKYFIIEENGLPTKNETRENIKLLKFKGFKGSIKASTLAQSSYDSLHDLDLDYLKS